MLKALSLALLLAVSPVLAKNTTIAPPKPATECLTPEGLTGTAPLPLRFRIEGETLIQFRTAYDAVAPVNQKSTDVVDLILVFGEHSTMGEQSQSPWIMVAFSKGCKIGARLVRPAVMLKLLSGGGTI